MMMKMNNNFSYSVYLVKSKRSLVADAIRFFLSKTGKRPKAVTVNFGLRPQGFVIFKKGIGGHYMTD